MKKFLLGFAALAFATSPAFAQEAAVETVKVAVETAKVAVETAEAAVKTEKATQVAEAVAPAIEKIEVNEDGSLSGKVFAKVAGEETPVDAKVTIASEGVVIDSVQAENGAFSFANIAPGAYTLTGMTQGFAGGQTYDVAPYAGTGCSSCNLGLQSTDVVYQDSPVYDAPCGSCGSSCGSCGSCCGGGLGGGGGFGGGGGGLLSGRNLLRAGLIGGVVAIAVGGDDDDDVSADE